ncbi:unnamed protein product [Notodromas monacha]|uniref:Uncharacterized protein n=1 Tax=Notodromas monacha TaxID=399045 RepID=A0A7R9G8P0_9CRUS|nr:unnamed protein product [Notodromas monacha]CAG0913474.1 unnamed protein product [Notodromas monacha]
MKLWLMFVLLLGAVAAEETEDEVVDTTVYKFATKPQNLTAKLGDTVRIACDVINEKGAPVLDDSTVLSVWLFGESALFAGPTRLNYDKRYNLDGRTLVIKDVKQSDGGKYTCQLSTSNAPKLFQFLVVHVPPTVKAVLETVVAKSGEDVTLRCDASGSPEPGIKWKKRGEMLAETGSTLTLEKVSHHQAGNYSCEADNGVGTAAANIRLDVLFKPIIKVEKQWIHSGENNQAELTCEISAQPRPIVQWLKDGVELDQETPHWTQSPADGSDIYTLELKNLKREHFGTYECQAVNDLGTDSKTIELSGVAHKAQFVSNPNGDKPDAYTLRWTVESFSPVTEYQLSYRRVKANESTDLPADWIKVTVPGDGTATNSRKHAKEFVVRNLALATEYEVSVQVINMFGSNEPATFKFATLGSKVAKVMTDASSTVTTSWITIAATLFAMVHATVVPLLLLPSRLV